MHIKQFPSAEKRGQHQLSRQKVVFIEGFGRRTPKNELFFSRFLRQSCTIFDENNCNACAISRSTNWIPHVRTTRKYLSQKFSWSVNQCTGTVYLFQASDLSQTCSVLHQRNCSRITMQNSAQLIPQVCTSHRCKKFKNLQLMSDLSARMQENTPFFFISFNPATFYTYKALLNAHLKALY